MLNSYSSFASDTCITKHLEPEFIAENGLDKQDYSVSVLIDQTTIADDNLKAKVHDTIASFLRENESATYSLNGYVFSSFLAGQYMQHDLKDVLHERSLTESQRNKVVKRNLQAFDSCQKTKSFTVVDKKLTAFLASAYANDIQLAKSDIMESFKKAGDDIRQSKARSKVVVIYSDMLENSTITSFYASNAVRKIDHTKELALVEKAGMFADFGGAKVYVMGAGLVSEQGKAKGVYRDPKMMQELKTFWTEWFKRSNAELVEFGAPEMLGSIQ
jgi:hypothetical protein